MDDSAASSFGGAGTPRRNWLESANSSFANNSHGNASFASAARSSLSPEKGFGVEISPPKEPRRGRDCRACGMGGSLSVTDFFSTLMPSFFAPAEQPKASEKLEDAEYAQGVVREEKHSPSLSKQQHQQASAGLGWGWGWTR
mmetsp:Transcript_20311/g.39430  ORF Transcript_20311/g.39430 Transcript_20311/m.39430 type:complete len:142 (+) Transcript_20311:1-426(+)